MNAFATPEWDSNPIADKTCSQLFEGNQFKSGKTKNKKGKKNKKLKIKTGRVDKVKETLNSTAINIKGVEHFKQINSKQVENQHNSAPFMKNKKQTNKSAKLPTQNTKHTNVRKGEENKVKRQKPKVTHQTLFCQTSRKARLKSKSLLASNKPAELKEKINSKKKLKRLKKKLYKTNQSLVEDQNVVQIQEKWKNRKQNVMRENCHITPGSSTKFDSSNKAGKLKEAKIHTEKLNDSLLQNEHNLCVLNKKQKAVVPLRQRMLEKLKAARFRYLNEQMYTSVGKDAKKYFEHDQDAYQAYHEGYKQQVARWPLNPLDVIIEKVKKLPRSHVIADFGCGEAKLAKSVPQTVHSFDLVAVDESVTACDMAKVPLENNCVDVVVFCLSLMGTNLKDYLLEAHRVLKVGGLLKIAEVESRFDSVDDFVKSVESFGFAKTKKDFSHDLFCFLDFIKKESSVKKKKTLPHISLNPCLYKRR